MARSRILRALSFRPTPVTLLTVITYVSITAALLWIHLVPPQVGSESELASWDIDFPQAWADLQEITKEFRPYNARRNDVVREYLLQRIKQILDRNKGYGYDGEVEIIDDVETNVIFPGETKGGLTVYYEGTNIMVHIHGSDPTLSPVLINAHYDSVSTGYGATDDGKAVVSVLQVINAFTSSRRSGDKRIKRGIVALLNNGEEDYLNGARAYAVHPIANKSHAFLNLEGAGAGGRATLFRSTDTEVTRFYQKSKRPFGMVISADGFKRGLISSQTDYKVFVENLGMRGLDVAYWHPRSRYHTQDDDVRHTSPRSLWHMLGTSLQTMNAMTSDTSREFDREGDNPAGTGSDAVWFDFLGRAFAVFKLHTLFALTITLIVVPFVVLAITGYGLYSSNKMYYFSNTPLVPAPPSHSDLPTTTRGWRGFFRFPVAFVVGSAATIGLAYLVQKVNPMIAYSSQYSVWAMFLSAWWCLVWFIMRGADAIRPSALGRGYAFLELWLLWFAVMIGVAVSANVHKLASGYFVLIIYSGITLSAWISLLELSALPKKRYSAPHRRHERVRSDGHSIIAPSETHDNEHSDDDHEDTPADESTPLFRGRDRPNTFHGYARTNIGTIPSSRTPSPPSETDDESDEGNSRVYPGEQSWASHLPAGTWIIQHLLSIPVPIMFVGNIMLLLSGALSQTGADGSDTLTVYLAMAVFSIIFLLPAAPFFHRISYHLTTVVFFVFVATLLTNLLSFPFDNDSRLKVYFQQTWDLTPGAPVAENKVHLIGHADFVKDIAEKYIPSARHTELSASPSLQRVGLAEVTWPGPAPNPVPKKSGRLPKMIVNATSPDPADSGMVRLVVSAEETRACRIDILNGRKVKDVSVYRRDHGDSDANKEVKKLGRVGRSGQIRLWRRSWDVEDAWEVTMRVVTADEMADAKTNDDDEGKDGVLELKVSCLWSDANSAEVNVPALWELWRFLPTWAAVSKLADGLVEGWIKTEVEVGR